MKKVLPMDVVRLCKLIMDFARVNRFTRWPDGVTPESDTDHTVMLGILACAFAADEVPDLDRGKIAQFSLVHDLIEAYAGDTNTFGLHKHADRKADKEAREAEAFKRIEKEFGGTFPWITETIQDYESLSTPEARYVKMFDKTLPKMTHLLNSGVALSSKKDFEEHCANQLNDLDASYGKGQPELRKLYAGLIPLVSAELDRTRKPEA